MSTIAALMLGRWGTVDDVAVGDGWVAAFARAVRINLQTRDIRNADPVVVAAAFGRVRYRFEGAAHPIEPAVVVDARGWAACADAAAAIAAAVIGSGSSGLLCLEAPTPTDSYRHVRVLVDGAPGPPTILDPYQRQRPPGLAPSCEWVATLSQFARPGPWTFSRAARGRPR